MRNWHEEDDVTVVYPSGRVRNGTIVNCKANGRFCVSFYEEDGADTADPNVQEHWLRVPGAQANAIAPPERGCD